MRAEHATESAKLTELERKKGVLQTQLSTNFGPSDVFQVLLKPEEVLVRPIKAWGEVLGTTTQI